MLKLLDVVGARPQFIKVSPILRAINDHNEAGPEVKINEVLVHTGQHYDEEMSEVFFDQLEIKEPEYNLGVGSGTHGHQTGEMLKRIEDVFRDETPDVVMVYGDTNSTLAGALAASKLNIPVAHVEAGLRSYNREMPEEINRVLTDHASDILFCPTETAAENLREEGFSNIVNNGNLVTDQFEGFSLTTSHDQQAKYDHQPQATGHKPMVINVGDVMYDASLQNVELAEEKSNILEKHHLKPERYALATVHRAENTDNPERLKNIFEALDKIASEKMPVIFPIHPRTEERIKDFDIMTGEIKIVPPVDYLDMINLESNAKVILTDSGGVQKEAYFYDISCITLREETEWIETVKSGKNVLTGPYTVEILEAFNNIEEDYGNGNVFYGEGRAAKNIIKTLDSGASSYKRV